MGQCPGPCLEERRIDQVGGGLPSSELLNHQGLLPLAIHHGEPGEAPGFPDLLDAGRSGSIPLCPGRSQDQAVDGLRHAIWGLYLEKDAFWREQFWTCLCEVHGDAGVQVEESVDPLLLGRPDGAHGDHRAAPGRAEESLPDAP